MLIKEIIYKEEIIYFIIKAQNVGTPNLIKQTVIDLQAHIDTKLNNSGRLVTNK
jgi:hypothetical protein